MDQKKIVDFFSDTGKVVIKVGTLTPVIRYLFSPKIIMLVLAGIYLIQFIDKIPQRFEGERIIYTLLQDADELIMIFYNTMYFLEDLFLVAAFVVLYRVTKQYLGEKNMFVLEFARKHGVLSEEEYRRKVAIAHEEEMKDSLVSIEKAGMLNKQKRKEVEKMIANHYAIKKKEEALAAALKVNALSQEEFDEKIAALKGE